MSQRPSIYDMMIEAEAEAFLEDEKSDSEADAELAKLEAGYVRFLNSTYRLWSPRDRYSFDRNSTLFSCLQNRRLLLPKNIAAMAEKETLNPEEIVEVTLGFTKWLKREQRHLLKIRRNYYYGSIVGTA